MALKLDKLSHIQKYFAGVAFRSNHHAKNVLTVTLPILGAVTLVADEISVKKADNESGMGNILWMTVRGNRYTFRYEHNPSRIELRKDSFRGPILHTFDNTVSAQEVLDIFENLFPDVFEDIYREQ